MTREIFQSHHREALAESTWLVWGFPDDPPLVRNGSEKLEAIDSAWSDGAQRYAFRIGSAQTDLTVCLPGFLIEGRKLKDSALEENRCTTRRVIPGAQMDIQAGRIEIIPHLSIWFSGDCSIMSERSLGDQSIMGLAIKKEVSGYLFAGAYVFSCSAFVDDPDPVSLKHYSGGSYSRFVIKPGSTTRIELTRNSNELVTTVSGGK